MEHNLIQSYIKELNQALREVAGQDTIEEFKKLNNLENKFARRLRSIAGGKQVYKDFISFIMEERDLREVRPFFRERENMYKGIINPAIRDRHPEVLHKMRINFLFCAFAIERLHAAVAAKNKENGTSIAVDPQILDIYEQVKKSREGLIHKHLHHALNRAKAFNRGVNSSMDFGDFIQTANEALVIAVDKYVIDENASPFHNMVIGRMVANLIASGSQSLPVTLGGDAERKLYKIRKLLEKTPGLTTKEVADIIGTAESEVAILINATEFKSLDEGFGKDEGGSPSMTLLEFLPSDANQHNDPYLAMEHKNLLQAAAEVFKSLTVLEQKALRLKGVNFDNLQ